MSVNSFHFHLTMWHLFVPNTLPSPYQYRYPVWYFSSLRSDVCSECSFNFFGAVYMWLPKNAILWYCFLYMVKNKKRCILVEWGITCLKLLMSQSVLIIFYSLTLNRPAYMHFDLPCFLMGTALCADGSLIVHCSSCAEVLRSQHRLLFWKSVWCLVISALHQSWITQSAVVSAHICVFGARLTLDYPVCVRDTERERERKSSEEEEATPSINCAHAKKLAPFSCCWPIFDVFALIHHRNCVSGFSWLFIPEPDVQRKQCNPVTRVQVRGTTSLSVACITRVSAKHHGNQHSIMLLLSDRYLTSQYRSR